MNVRAALVMLLLGALAGCMSAQSFKRGLPGVAKSDSAPRANAATLAQLAALPDPVVKKEKLSKWGNGPVYTVLGRSYKVMGNAAGFWQEGRASWYGTKFHGNRTSNGERFDMYGLSAAHRHLPLPSYVRVTNLSNGKSTIVRVNDRGPFHADRVIDLSYAAAVKLGFHNLGTARVRVEVVSPSRAAPKIFLLQAGAFRELENADRLQRELAILTGARSVVVKTSDDGFYRVQLGPVRGDKELERVKRLLQRGNYGPPRVLPSFAGE